MEYIFKLDNVLTPKQPKETINMEELYKDCLSLHSLKNLLGKKSRTKINLSSKNLTI
jgi:hypothetical protein